MVIQHVFEIASTSDGAFMCSRSVLRTVPSIYDVDSDRVRIPSYIYLAVWIVPFLCVVQFSLPHIALFISLYFMRRSILKLVLKTDRPPHYHKSSSKLEMLSLSSGVKRINLGVMIPGDQYSFPSGHTLRAFATVRIVMCDTLLNSQFGMSDLLGPDNGLGSSLLVVLAISTAWARVALGKHSVHDVIGGMILGIFFGEYFERIVGDDGRWIYQMLCLSYFTAIGIYCLLDLTLLRDDPFGVRAKLGFVDYEHEFLFVALPVLGSWIFATNWTACTFH
eukprot:m.973655 g.973655  ORF g.973655 m.973655 type:complete len:278 (+) comp23936_c0_seq6:760-1593(+)